MKRPNHAHRTLFVLALSASGLLVTASCGPTPVDTEGPDAGGGPVLDAGGGPPDAGPLDAGPVDAGTPDAGSPDAGDGADAGTADGGAWDAGAEDGGAGPACGDGVLDDGEACDDGNTVDGDGCSAQCELQSLCPSEAPDCEAAAPAVLEHHMGLLEPCAFALSEPTDEAEGDALIDELVVRAGGARSIADVLGHLNREALSEVSPDTADRLKNHDFWGFRWNSGDQAVTYWYPQGITGSSDARQDGRVAGRRLVLVSWYNKTDARPTKGARLSLVDLTDPARVRYRHLLLVQPFRGPDGVDFGPAEYDSGDALHVGGIAWLGDRLYVADTAVGLRVYDLSRMIEVTHTDDSERIGVTAARIDAHGYRYAVPQLARYRLAPESCRVRFSFVSLDRSSDPPTLVTGEYHADDPDGRIVSWPVDPVTGRLVAHAGTVHAVNAVVGGQTRMQGGLTWEGNWYISSSSQYLQYGRLYRTRPYVESSVTAWPNGCEDLYYERDTGRIWTTAEHPYRRDTVGIPLLPP